MVGSTTERAATTARALGIEHSTADWEAAIGDPAIDVVHVCLPNDLHATAVLAALNAGKHVLCEKPLARSYAEAVPLVAAAEASDRVPAVCHNYRFYPLVVELRWRLANAALGRPHAVRGHYLQDWLLEPGATNWRVDAERGGSSRTIADIGTHWIDLVEFVTGRRLEAVMAQVSTIHRQRPEPAHSGTFGGHDVPEGATLLPIATEDQATLLLRFEDGLQGSVALSQVAAGHANDLHLAIDGSDGSAMWEQETPDVLRISPRGAAEQRVTRSAGSLSVGAAALSRLPAGHGEGWADALRNLIGAVYATIDGSRDPAEADAAPLPTFADGLRHLAFVGAALRSAADGRWVTIHEQRNEETE